MSDQYGNLYFWLPIVAPIIGGLIGGRLFKYLIERPPDDAEDERRARGEPDRRSRARRVEPPHRCTTPERPAHHQPSTTAAQRRAHHGRVRRSRRPGHHQHPLHDLRPRRATRWPATSSSTSRSCPRPAGSSTTRWRSGSAPARCIQTALRQGRPARASDLAALGITNQRETTVVWDKQHRPALLQRDRLAGHPHRPDRQQAGARRPRRPDPRSAPGCRRRRTSPAARSSGSSRTSTASARPPRRGDALFGNTDTWLIWNLTGGTDGGVHVTDVDQRQPHDADGPRDAATGTTSCSALFDIPRAMLPEIRSSSEPGGYGTTRRQRPVRRRGADHRHPRRPAGRHGRAGLLRARARPRTPTAPATSCCSTPAPSSSAPSTAC